MSPSFRTHSRVSATSHGKMHGVLLLMRCGQIYACDLEHIANIPKLRVVPFAFPYLRLFSKVSSTRGKIDWTTNDCPPLFMCQPETEYVVGHTPEFCPVTPVWERSGQIGDDTRKSTTGGLNDQTSLSPASKTKVWRTFLPVVLTWRRVSSMLGMSWYNECHCAMSWEPKLSVEA